MIFGLLIILTATFGYFIHIQNLENIFAIVLTINFIYFFNRIKMLGLQMAFRNLLFGEVIHSFIYMAWLAYYHKQTYVFFVPLFLSSICKAHLSMTSKERVDEGLIEEIILFQAKAEVFIFGYLLLSLFYSSPIERIDKIT